MQSAEREQLIDPKLVELHDSFLWLIDIIYMNESFKMAHGSYQEQQPNQAVLLAAIVALWWILCKHDSYNMSQNEEYQD